MALTPDSQRPFRLYVTHVDSEAGFLKISGQLDHQASLMIESLFISARDNLEKGIGVVPASAIQEGILCAAKYKDGKYYRAKIMNSANLAPGMIYVHFIDFGNKDIISLSTIRFLDSYDPLFLQLSPQATDYYLARVIHPMGRWDQHLLLKMQNLLCYSEYSAAIEAHTRTLPIISIQFKGSDCSAHLVANQYGVALPIPRQEIMLLNMLENQGHWSPTMLLDPPTYTEHVPFLINQNFPNPASAMRVSNNVSMHYNGATVHGVSQRLVVNKAKNLVNLRAPVRQPQQALTNVVQPATPPPTPVTMNKAGSPKKATTYKSTLLEVNSQHKVLVTYAQEGPELFAVQMADGAKFQEMMAEINKRPHSSLKEPPMIGTVCLGRMSPDGVICRAIVMNLSGTNCKLYFVDFGETEMVSYYDIFDIPEEFVKPNIFAMRFCLSGVKKLEKGPQLNKAFKQLVVHDVLTLRVVPPEGPPLIQYGELYLNNQNVLDILLANKKEKLQFKWLDKLPLGTRQSVLVSYVDSCIKFYVQLSDNIDDLNTVMNAVKAHCENSSSPGELAVGAACCAKFPDDANWYRAIVRETRGNKVVVVYVDYGNEQEVNVEDLRTITPDLIKLPAQAMKCALKGFENKPVETKTSNQLEMIALEKTLMAHVVGMLSNDTMIVTLVDDTDIPPLDVARKMTQLSMPRSVEPKVTTPNRKEAPENFSSPEGSVPDDSRKKSFRREKSFKDDRRPRDGEDLGQRGSSFRGREQKENFERSAPGRHSEKYGSKPERVERGERRGPPRPYENNTPVSPPADDEWEESPAVPAAPQPSYSRPARDNGRDSDNKFGQQDEDNQTNDRGRHFRQDRERPFRQDNRGERRDNWGDKKEGWNQKREFRDNRAERGGRNDRGGYRSNFTPRDRADKLDRSQNSDSDKRSERSFHSGDKFNRPYKSRSQFTQVQHKELSDPIPFETPFSEPTIELGSQQEVSITWIVSPENFHTQILSLQPKFIEMMHKIPELYKGVKPYSADIPVGSSVLARYPADGVLYRATVESVQPFSKFIVRYVDYGNRQLVEAKDIWQIERELMEIPKMAVHCSLTGVAPKEGKWKADPEIDLCFNAPRYQCIFQDYVENQYRVSLWNNGVSTADLLVEKELATMSEPQSSVTLKDEAIDLTIIVGQQILCRVTYVESYEKFYVQLDLDKADLVESAIANFDFTKLTPLSADSLAEGVHCTVKHEGKIYRAILNDVSDTRNVCVVLPDYGNDITTSIDNLMILPTELSVYYYQSLHCRLNNYSADCTVLMPLDQLKGALTGNKFIVYVNDVDEIVLVSTLYDPVTGQKVAVFEPDEGAYDEVVPFCTRAVFNYNFGNAYVSHVENLNEFYLQKSEDGDRLGLLLEQLYSFYEEGTPEPLAEFEADTLCAAKSSDGNWYRATILSCTGDEVKVHFSDYGNSETVGKDAIKKLDPKFLEPCSLALVASLGLLALQEDAVAKLLEWTTEKEVQVTLAFGTDGWLANLHLDGVSLSDKLVNAKLAAPQVVSEEVVEEHKPEDEAPVEEPISLPDGCSQVYISHIDSPGQFWLQMLDKIDKVDEIQAELQTNSESYPDIETCEMGTLCVAKYSVDDQWYRAEILDSDTDIITIRFLDYGNTDVLDNQPGLIKAVPDHLKDVERYAIKASVNAIPTGTGQWSEPASDYFTQLVGDLSTPVDALIVLKDVTTYVDIFVNGQNLTDKLVSEGHATRSEESECGSYPSCFASHVNSPSEFWIQLESAAPELQSMETAMDDAENFPELHSKEEGVLCAAKYPEDGAWYRAQVIVDGSEGTEVLFMDYGNASIVSELRSLPEELQSKPALSRKCALQKPPNVKAWSRKSEVKFNELAAEGATIFNVQFIAAGDISIVDLFLEGKSVSDELAALCEEHPASERPTPVGQDLHSSGKICYINSLEEFYVQLDDSLANLDIVNEKLNGAEDFETVGDLKVGSVCAALWNEDERWYRCKILEFCDVGYHVQFIDYGNKAKCDEFRQLPEDIAGIEPLAKCCRLSGFAEDATNESAKSKLEDLEAELVTFQIEFLDSLKEPSLVRLLLNGTDISCILKSESPEPNAESENVVQQKEQAEEITVEQKEKVDEEIIVEQNEKAKEEIIVEQKEKVNEEIRVEQKENVKEEGVVEQKEKNKDEIIVEQKDNVQKESTLQQKEEVNAEQPQIEEDFLDAENIGDANDLNSSNNDLNDSTGSTNTVVEQTLEQKDISTSEITSDETQKAVDESEVSKKDSPESVTTLKKASKITETVTTNDESKTSEKESPETSPVSATLDEAEALDNKTPSTPDNDLSTETLQSSIDSCKIDKEESKESLNTDTGYASESSNEKSTKEPVSPDKKAEPLDNKPTTVE
ncbi:maternal protein tudor isoform X2 [Bicyclus anynana]|uniref:Maternal protein tudor isoform X2 n=1 Tax=Bicyclus anynana TaxID=110368 RepID=A0ABM3LRM3_BICAN|nr:maternal protein tudor isoform X2 [Bicyclus anynana]